MDKASQIIVRMAIAAEVFGKMTGLAVIGLGISIKFMFMFPSGRMDKHCHLVRFRMADLAFCEGNGAIMALEAILHGREIAHCQLTFSLINFIMAGEAVL